MTLRTDLNHAVSYMNGVKRVEGVDIKLHKVLKQTVFGEDHTYTE